MQLNALLLAMATHLATTVALPTDPPHFVTSKKPPTCDLAAQLDKPQYQCQAADQKENWGCMQIYEFQRKYDTSLGYYSWHFKLRHPSGPAKFTCSVGDNRARTSTEQCTTPTDLKSPPGIPVITVVSVPRGPEVEDGAAIMMRLNGMFITGGYLLLRNYSVSCTTPEPLKGAVRVPRR